MVAAPRPAAAKTKLQQAIRAGHVYVHK